MKYVLIFIFSFTGFLYSCKDVPCKELNAGFEIRGYTETEFDSLIIRKYTKGSNFSNPLDSAFIDSIDLSHMWANNYFIVYPDFSDGLRVKSKYDYEVYIPSKSRLYKVQISLKSF